MTTYRPRGTSPPTLRRYGDPRFSTPQIIASPFDTRYPQQPRASVDTLTSPRPAVERHYEAQPISKRTYVDSGYSGPKSRTEYAIRPSHNPSKADEGRRPLTVLVPPASPIQDRPLVNNSS